MDVKLKPCPFCGGEAEEFTGCGSFMSNRRYWCIRCKECGSAGAITIHPKNCCRGVE